MSGLTGNIESKIAPLVEGHGCEVVRVALFGQGKGRTLQVMIEKADGAPVNITDCENVSRELSVYLDVHDMVKGHYNLEISSTGIDRPLVKPSDFERFTGKYVVVRTYILKGGRKIFKGLLESASENGINLKLDSSSQDDGLTYFEYSEISSAHIDGFRK